VEYHVNYGGHIQIWDITTGSELAPLRPGAKSAPIRAELDPTGRYLVCGERPSYFSSAPKPQDITVVWELATGKKWTLCDGWTHPSFFPDGKTVALGITGRETKTAVLRLIDLTTGKEQAEVSFGANFPDRQFALGPVAPDGAVIAVFLNNKGAPAEVWFRDGKTLEDRGKLVLAGDAQQSGWSSGLFSWDGKSFIALDPTGTAWIWDVAERKVVRTLVCGSNLRISGSALSPDGKTLAVGWIPDFDITQVHTYAPDPLELPQPRMSLLTLDGSAPPQVLIAPPGGVSCSIAFSPDGKTLAYGNHGAVHLFDLTK
jgi:WD40 repeat protein